MNHVQVYWEHHREITWAVFSSPGICYVTIYMVPWLQSGFQIVTWFEHVCIKAKYKYNYSPFKVRIFFGVQHVFQALLRPVLSHERNQRFLAWQVIICIQSKSGAWIFFITFGWMFEIRLKMIVESINVNSFIRYNSRKCMHLASFVKLLLHLNSVDTDPNIELIGSDKNKWGFWHLVHK